MNTLGKVLLIVGPAGSGKSTLATYTAQKLDWQLVEEDAYWVKHGWTTGTRTEEQERRIQSEAAHDIINSAKNGKSVVLEFILYKNPPNPLTEYVERLQKAGIEYNVVALKPSLEEILKRRQKRGRDHDIQNISENTEHAKHQLHCLEEDYIKAFTIDSTNLSVEDTFKRVRAKL